MNLNVAICLLAVTASAKADGALGLEGLGGLVYAPGHASADYYSYPRYAFEYAVKDPHTGDNKAQWEKRDGDVVKGAYSLVEPDGSLRVVEYWADDKSGFNAVVKRLGPNLHPTTVHAAPIYKAPIPVLSHGPIASHFSVGSVANLGHLASAPLISGPIHGPAVSSQNLIKEPVPIVKSVLPAPIHHEPIIKSPIYNSGPIYSEPLGPLPGPIYKSGPIYSEPLGPLPNYRAPLPIYREPIPVPVYKDPIPVPVYKEPIPVPVYNYKEPIPVPVYNEALPLWKGPLEPGHIGGYEVIGKGPIGYDGLGRGLLGLGGHGLAKGPLPYVPNYDFIEKAPAWNGPLEYPLYPGGYKH